MVTGEARILWTSFAQEGFAHSTPLSLNGFAGKRGGDKRKRGWYLFAKRLRWRAIRGYLKGGLPQGQGGLLDGDAEPPDAGVGVGVSKGKFQWSLGGTAAVTLHARTDKSVG